MWNILHATHVYAPSSTGRATFGGSAVNEAGTLLLTWTGSESASSKGHGEAVVRGGIVDFKNTFHATVDLYAWLIVQGVDVFAFLRRIEIESELLTTPGSALAQPYR